MVKIINLFILSTFIDRYSYESMDEQLTRCITNDTVFEITHDDVFYDIMDFLQKQTWPLIRLQVRICK